MVQNFSRKRLQQSAINFGYGLALVAKAAYGGDVGENIKDIISNKPHRISRIVRPAKPIETTQPRLTNSGWHSSAQARQLWAISQQRIVRLHNEHAVLEEVRKIMDNI